MNLWFVIILTAVAAGAAFSTGAQLLFRLFYALVILIAISYFWAKVNTRGLKIERKTASTRAQVGDILDEEFRVSISSRIPKLWIELRDLSNLPGHKSGTVLSVGGRSRSVWKNRTTLLQRGQFTLGPLEIVSGDPFGLFKSSFKVPLASKLLVYPATPDLPYFRIPGGKLSSHGRIREPSRAVTPNASGVREYVSGDGFGKIHWLSTARKNKFMVKEFDQEPNNETWILLDLDAGVQAGEGKESTEEYAVTAAAAIAKRLLETGRAVGVAGFGNRHELVLPGKGNAQLIRILDSLAVIRADGKTDLLEALAAHSSRLGRNSGLVVITSSSNDHWVRGVQQLLRRGVKACIVLLEPDTFGGKGNSLLVASELIANQIPTYFVQQNCDFGKALSTDGGF